MGKAGFEGDEIDSQQAGSRQALALVQSAVKNDFVERRSLTAVL